jgi:hypothetical protein
VVVYNHDELKKIWTFILFLGETEDDRQQLSREVFPKLFNEIGALPLVVSFEFILGYWRSEVEREGAYAVPLKTMVIEDFDDLYRLAPDFRVFCLEKLFNIKSSERYNSNVYEEVWNFREKDIISLIEASDSEEGVLLLRHIQREVLKPDEKKTGLMKRAVMILIFIGILFLIFRGSLLAII